MKNGLMAGMAGFIRVVAIGGLALAALLAASPAQAQDAVEPAGDGTAGNPFQITQMGHLVWMAATVDASAGKHYSLLNDIDASDTTNWNAGAGFSPIGDNAVPFLGILNGNGNAIRHLVINRPGENEVGLIGFMESPALVRDLRLENGTVAASSYVGGLVGWINRGTVSNCTATGSVEANTTVGGLAGYNNEGTLSLCSFTGTVTGVNIVGGLVGENNGAIADCSAASQVTGGDRAGGLAGINLSTVANSHATGLVSGVSYIGGLIGRSSFGSIAGCSAAGDVAGLESAGGLVGYLYNGSLNACRASGSVMVSGTGWGAGGLVGYSTGSSLAACHATGPVTGRDGCGGLVGDNSYGSASRCYAAGAVTGSDYVGGLMGYNGASPVGDCYATGDVTGTSGNVGGLVGFNHYTTVARCYASGFVTGSTWSGGLVGGEQRHCARQLLGHEHNRKNLLGRRHGHVHGGHDAAGDICRLGFHEHVANHRKRNLPHLRPSSRTDHYRRVGQPGLRERRDGTNCVGYPDYHKQRKHGTDGQRHHVPGGLQRGLERKHPGRGKPGRDGDFQPRGFAGLRRHGDGGVGCG
jgi:hypothetical protein